jgi:hypothetical protein
VLDGDQAPVADDRDAVAQTLDLVEVVRGQKDRRAALALLGHDLVELLLHERIQPARRLVEDQQLGRVKQGLDEADLLAVAARQMPHRPVEVGGEALGELARAAEAPQPAQRGQERHDLAAGASRIEGELARQVFPSRARIAWLSRRLSRPNSRAWPLVGCSRSSSVRIVVVLPAPLGPRKPNTSPRSTDSETSPIPRALP